MTVPLSVEQARRIQAAIDADSRRMTMQLARELDVPEVEIVRRLPATVELDPSRWEEVIRALERLGRVHVIVSNGGATLEAEGVFGNFSTWGEFFNVQTESLDMHIRWPEIASILAVEKPSHMNGVNTLSLQFFERAGNVAFKVFLNFGGKASPELARHFRDIRQQFGLRVQD